MSSVRMPLLLAVFGWASMRGQHDDLSAHKAHAYNAAFIDTISRPGHTQLAVFPFNGEPFLVPIRTASGPFAYSPDGTALYGQCSLDSDYRTKIALCRIDIKTGLTTPLPGSTGLYARDIAVAFHEDIVLVSGVLRRDKTTRGVFELSIPSGKIRTILLQDGRSTHSAWIHLSVAPDGKRAVASHDGRVDVIDLVQGKAEPLDGGLFIAAWSPDGKWLAAVENGEEGRTILMDATTLQGRRTLGPSELGWSPDSRYLLGLKSCDPYYGTIEVIDIETGERTAIKSSKCQINQATTGWVSNDLAEK
jgi:WD40 repeat protein